MYLAGKKTAILKTSTPTKEICVKCHKSNSTEVSVYGIYKHLLQIPFLSGGKTGKAICTHCKLSYELNEMPDSIKLHYYEIKESIKTPIWFYIGLIGIKTLVLIKIFSKYY